MISNILIIDTETTGLSPDKNKMIEIAVILFNLQTKSVLQSFSTLLPCDVNEAYDINRLEAEATRLPMVDRCLYMPILLEMVEVSDVMVAHNAKFDIGFIKRAMPNLLVRPVICTKQDFKWPMLLYRMRLEDICNASGVPYINAHRAMADCNLLVECFKKVPDLENRFKTAINFKVENKFNKGREVNFNDRHYTLL